MKLYLSKRALVVVLASIVPQATACRPRSEATRAGDVTPLDRTAWLGSAEGWGLLGLPLVGGPLTYLGAESLEAPTWAPPELPRLLNAWPGEGTVWIQFGDSTLGSYDYSTGYLRTFEGERETDLAVASEEATGLVIALDEQTLELVGAAEEWRFPLGSRLVRLERAGEGRVLAVVEGDSEAELVVLKPPESEPLGRRRVAGVQDLVVGPWGRSVYYVPKRGDAMMAVHELSLPKLEVVSHLTLPEPGRAIDMTPSGHRIYVAAGHGLVVFDRLSGRKIKEIELSDRVSALRFGVNGANLIARLEGEDWALVLQVGVDSVLGTIPSEWGDNLPAALPGGRLVTRVGTDLVLYGLPGLAEIARAETDSGRVWLPVDWHPPRPRGELVRGTAERPETRAAAGQARRGPSEPTAAAAEEPEAGARPGFYAVVSAARTRGGVDKLVTWLRSVGYPAITDRHQDVMGVIWFRAMVGPYPSRTRAESAARSLGARYGYKPWILSIDDPGSRPPSAIDSIAGRGER